MKVSVLLKPSKGEMAYARWCQLGINIVMTYCTVYFMICNAVTRGKKRKADSGVEVGVFDCTLLM